jgi:hypothetical protein
VLRFICSYAECHYAECHYAECHYAECHYAECHNAKCRGTVDTWFDKIVPLFKVLHFLSPWTGLKTMALIDLFRLQLG